MAFVSPSKGFKNQINVTPLVDVVLVLLIIIMVVTPLLHRGKDVTLPSAKTNDATKAPDAIVISLPADHSIWLDATRVGKDELGSRLSAALQHGPASKILLKGDETLSVREVREVLAAAKASGARSVSLGVAEVKR